jgi:hypothetical protein
MRDFTLATYRDFIGSLVSHDVYTVKKYILTRPKKGIVLRHDVDVSAEKALRMARIDHEMKVQSTYYFRYPKTFNPEILKKIAEMGHEIGYHYEVLDKTQGNIVDAMKLFGQELNLFREYVDIATVSMHGGVLTKYDNREIWKHSTLSDYGLIGEPYLSIDYSKIRYFTDTGRDWSGKYAVKDNVDKSGPGTETIKSTADLLALLKKNESDLFVITIHPKRWSATETEWWSELIIQSIKNRVKSLIKMKG